MVYLSFYASWANKLQVRTHKFESFLGTSYYAQKVLYEFSGKFNHFFHCQWTSIFLKLSPSGFSCQVYVKTELYFLSILPSDFVACFLYLSWSPLWYFFSVFYVFNISVQLNKKIQKACILVTKHLRRLLSKLSNEVSMFVWINPHSATFEGKTR